MGEIDRDRWGRPMVVGPDGRKRAYTRATTLAKATDDEGGLTKWSMRQVIAGAVARPDLFALASTQLDEKGVLDKTCEALKEAAASSRGANLGTALHALTERLDGGLPLGVVLPELQPDLDAYVATMEASGIETVPGMLERFVVLDDLEVAGSFDRLLRLPDGRVVVGDLKTGADLSYSWRSIAVQLAVYAHGQLYEDGKRSPLPAGLDQTVGVVMHLPAGKGACTLYELDLTAGWEAAQLSMRVRQWRSRRDLAREIKPQQRLAIAPTPPVSAEGGQDDPALPASCATPSTAASPGSGAALPPTTAAEEPFRTAHEQKAAHLCSVERWQWARARLALVLDRGGQDQMVARWPVDVPTLREHVHTDAQLDAIARVLADVEAIVRSPFPDADPAEGDDMSAEDITALGKRMAALPKTMQDRMPQIYAEAEASCRPISVRAIPSRRRFAIVRALIICAEAVELDDAVMRHLLEVVLADASARTSPLGAVVGTLTPDQAGRLAELATDIGSGELVIGWAADGTPRAVPATTNNTINQQAKDNAA